MSRTKQTTITADERVARLKRDCKAAGIYVEDVARNKMRAYLEGGRTLEFRPGGGRGLWVVEAREYPDGPVDSEVTRTDAALQTLLERAVGRSE